MAAARASCPLAPPTRSAAARAVAAAPAAAPSPLAAPCPLLLLKHHHHRRRHLRLADSRPASLGRSGASSFKGGSGSSSFSSSSSAPKAAKAPAAAGGAGGSSSSAAGPGRSGASAFAGSGPGRSGASSFAAAGSSSSSSPSSAPSSSLLKSLPTALTVARVVAIPAVLALWFSPAPSAPLWCAALFAASCFTDWLDGFLARALDASTPFGAFLDPVADKLTVAATLVLLSTRAPAAPSPLASAGLAWFVPVASIAIIGREIAMSALREWAATLGPEARATVAVGALGKVKTAAQMTSIALLLLTRDGGASAAAVGLSAGVFEAAAKAGPPLLLVAAGLTKLSLLQYLVALWPWISGKKKPAPLVAA